MHKRHNTYGLTLIEMVIAMILLTFIGMNLLQFFNNICSVELRSKNRTTAVKLAQKIMEDYMSRDPNSSIYIVDVPYTSIAGHEEYQYKVDTGDLELPENTFPQAIPFPAFRYRIKQITITLKGPLGDGNQDTMHTQKVTLKAWRALAPSGL